ncbi:MAG: CoA transferase [Dehalococcoidia bacterium]|nr:CoA transferase [Dehalococcoidia bacterium]
MSLEVSGFLEGLRVLDLSHWVAGPYATRLMAIQGAEVIKVERPDGGDPARRVGPYPDDTPDINAGALHLYLNSSKKSITLDISTVTGRKILQELVEWAEVVVENFHPRVMTSLGLDYESLRAQKSSLVMTSISNFGQTGPYRDYEAKEINLYAAGGLMYITGDPEKEPLQMAARLAQYGAGQNAFAGTLSALWHRDSTGEGQQVDVAISEYLATILENALSMYSYAGANFQRTGNRGYGRAAWGPYPCRNGYVGVIAGPDHKWPEMAELMGIPELGNPKFDDRAGRGENADELDSLMLPWLMAHDKRDIFERAQNRGLAFSYVATPEDILGWEHLESRDYFVEVEHPGGETLRHPSGPFKTDEMKWRLESAPSLGDHNREVICGLLGYSNTDLIRLRGMKVI